MRFRRKQTEEGPAVEETPDPRPQTPDPEPPPAQSPLSADAASNGADHPEVLVGAAFVGGFALALIMKRFGR